MSHRMCQCMNVTCPICINPLHLPFDFDDDNPLPFRSEFPPLLMCNCDSPYIFHNAYVRPILNRTRHNMRCAATNRNNRVLTARQVVLNFTSCDELDDARRLNMVVQRNIGEIPPQRQVAPLPPGQFVAPPPGQAAAVRPRLPVHRRHLVPLNNVDRNLPGPIFEETIYTHNARLVEPKYAVIPGSVPPMFQCEFTNNDGSNCPYTSPVLHNIVQHFDNAHNKKICLRCGTVLKHNNRTLNLEACNMAQRRNNP